MREKDEKAREGENFAVKVYLSSGFNHVYIVFVITKTVGYNQVIR